MMCKAEDSPFEVGKDYMTRGGWNARVIHISNDEFESMYAIHKPGEKQEMGPILHDSHIGVAMDELSRHPPPAFDGHPADIMLPEKEGSGTNMDRNSEQK